MKFPHKLQARLDEIEKEGCKRLLKLRRGIDLSSNDYLGFSQDPVLIDRVRTQLSSISLLGASGSRLIRGHLELFEEVEKQLADFCGREAAILFPSGYQANVGILSAILTEKDVVYSDQLNHASIVDGIRLSRAQKQIYLHRDLDALRQLLTSTESPSGVKVIVTESLFSMDGTLAPLQDLAKLAREFSALLIVDESHATGLWGAFDRNQGGGLVQEYQLTSEVFATVHTGGKALGAGGAWIAGDEDLKDYLVNFSRPLIFSTAPVPALAILLRESIHHWNEVGVLKAKEVHSRSNAFCNRLYDSGSLFDSLKIGLPHSPSPILPFILGENRRALEVSARLQSAGFDVRAIRPPTVPQGTARLRVTLNLNSLDSDLETFSNYIPEILREVNGDL